MFTDESFIKAARDLTCRILIENSLYDISTVLPEQWTNHVFCDALAFPESGEQNLRYIPIYSLIINKLLDLNSKMARKKSMKIRNSIKEFEKTFDRLFLNFIADPTPDVVNQLDAIKREFKNDFSGLIQNKQEINFIKHLYADGKSNLDQFRKFKSKKKVAHKLCIDGVEMTDPKDLVQIFASHHKEVTASNVEHRTDFHEFEEFCEFTLDDIFPQTFQVSDTINLADIQSVLTL